VQIKRITGVLVATKYQNNAEFAVEMGLVQKGIRKGRCKKLD
jgi:hypothetical protein